MVNNSQIVNLSIISFMIDFISPFPGTNCTDIPLNNNIVRLTINAAIVIPVRILPDVL